MQKSIKEKNNKYNISVYLVSLFLFFIIICITLNPQVYTQSVYNGLIIWAKAVLPTLFPFFFITKLLTELGAVKKISRIFSPITKKMFNVNGIASYVYIMSIMSGYPVGAKMTSELYHCGQISKQEAYRMTTFTSTSGPLFIIGTVGAGFLFSKNFGYIIFFSHILSALFNGILWRKYKSHENEFKIKILKEEKKIDDMLGETIYSSVISILLVGGYIAIFFMLIDLLINTGVLSLIASIIPFIDKGVTETFLSGLIEMTRGCYDVSITCQNVNLSIIMCVFIISFGGISTHLQSLAFLKSCNIKYSFFFLQKLTQAIISAIFACILIFIFL